MPYAGAAVGAMYGPYRRRASGDAAVARVVGCTVARPLVRILLRGGCGFCCRSWGGGAVCSACPPPGVGLFDGVIGLRTVVIHVPYKGVNPPAPVAMQGDAVSGYGF